MTPVSLGPPSGQFVLSGLNWQFQFAPVTSLMMSGLPAPPPPVLLLVVPHAATTKPAAPSRTPSDLSRLIICLALRCRFQPECDVASGTPAGRFPGGRVGALFVGLAL